MTLKTIQLESRAEFQFGNEWFLGKNGKKKSQKRETFSMKWILNFKNLCKNTINLSQNTPATKILGSLQVPIIEFKYAHLNTSGYINFIKIISLELLLVPLCFMTKIRWWRHRSRQTGGTSVLRLSQLNQSLNSIEFKLQFWYSLSIICTVFWLCARCLSKQLVRCSGPLLVTFLPRPLDFTNPLL
jgi:hypothetical protein